MNAVKVKQKKTTLIFFKDGISKNEKMKERKKK